MLERANRDSINAEKASHQVHFLIRRYDAGEGDLRVGGIIQLEKDHDRNCIHYLRSRGIGIRHRHTPSEKMLTFRNTLISVLKTLLRTGQLGDVKCIYVGPFGRKRKKNGKKKKGRRHDHD